MTVPKALKNQRGNGYSGGKRELARDNAHAGGGRLVQAGGKSGRKSGKRAPRVITWDDDARKEFITGFRKRKNERRQHARQKIAEEVRQNKEDVAAMKADMAVVKAALTPNVNPEAATPQEKRPR